MANYDGFMSYSHAADDRLAPALQAALHALGRPWYRLRALRIFRDKTSLAATPGLWPGIEEALRASRWFVLLASPQAAASPWVRREIDWWLSHRDLTSMLVVLTEGQLRWDAGRGDFDWTATDALPASLAGRFAVEPLWVDLRWARGQDKLSLRQSAFRAAVLDLAAPLHGRPKDELDGADVRQYRRNRRTAIAAVALLALLAAAASVAAIQAVQQSRLAASRELAAYALSQVDADPELAMRLSLEALNRAQTPQAEDALRRSLQTSRHLRTVTLDKQPWRLRHTPDGRMLVAVGRDVLLIDGASGGLSMRLRGHDGHVQALAASDDGRMAASGDHLGKVQLWDLASGRSLRTIQTSRHAVDELRFVPNRGLLVSTHGMPPEIKTNASGRPELGDMERVLIWRLDTGERVATLDHGAPVSAMAIDAQHRWLATAGTGRPLKLWSLQGLRLEREFDLGPDAMPVLAFSADGNALLAVDNNLALRRWDLSRGTLTQGPSRLPSVNSTAESSERLAWFDHRAQRVVQVDRSGVRLVDLAGRAPERQVAGVPTNIQHAVFNADDTLLALVAGNGSTFVVDLASGELRHTLRGHADSVNAVEFTPDGQRLFTGGNDDTLRTWDVRLQERDAPVARHKQAVTQVMWHEGAQRLATGGDDGVVHVVDAQGRPLHAIEGPGRVSSLAFSGDGQRLLVGRFDASGAALWDLRSGQQLLALKGLGHAHEVLEGVDFSPDERIVVAFSGERVLRWDAVTGVRLPDLVDPDGAPSPTDAASSQKRACGYSRATGLACMATARHGVSRLWNVTSGQVVGELAGHLESVMHTAMSDDGRWWAAANGEALDIWNLATRTRQVLIPEAGWTMALHFSADGQRVATTGGKAADAARSWDARSGKLVMQSGWHAGTIESARYSPDGRLFLTASADHTVKVWLASTGTHVATFDAHRGMVFDAVFSGDGRHVFTASNDGTVRKLDCRLCIDLPALLKHADLQPPRALLPRERSQYLQD